MVGAKFCKKRSLSGRMLFMEFVIFMLLELAWLVIAISDANL